MIAAANFIAALLLGSLKGGEHVDNRNSFRGRRMRRVYVALGERNPWGALFVALVLTFLSYATARMVEAAAVNATASGSQHRTMRAISHLIARSLSVSAPTSSAT
jgi:hypothetical protein